LKPSGDGADANRGARLAHGPHTRGRIGSGGGGAGAPRFQRQSPLADADQYTCPRHRADSRPRRPIILPMPPRRRRAPMPPLDI
jgi:hypothetical protein